MLKTALVLLGLIAAVWSVPLPGKDFCRLDLNGHNSVTVEFLWSGVPTTLTAIDPVRAPGGGTGFTIRFADSNWKFCRGALSLRMERANSGGACRCARTG